MEPAFIVIGTMKGGTTALHRYLCEHPQIEPAMAKELNYFDPVTRASRSDYRARFPVRPRLRLGRAEDLRTFEATPGYLFDPCVPDLMSRVVSPSTKFVALLREPVARSVSHVRMAQKEGWEDRDLLDALRAEDDRIDAAGSKVENLPRSEHRRAYRLRGHYAEQLERWFDRFDRNRFLLLRSEDLRDATQATFDQICGFLDLDPYELSSTAPRNVGPDSRIPDEARAYLEPRLLGPNEHLERITGITWP